MPTKSKRAVKSPARAARKRKRPTLGERLIESMDEVIRYFKGEPNNIRVSRRTLTPLQVVRRDLLNARDAASMTSADVVAAGVPVAVVRRCEKGPSKNLRLEDVEQYAKAVGKELRLSVVTPEPAKADKQSNGK